MTENTDDLRIQRMNELIAPEQLISDLQVSDTAADTVSLARHTIHNILAVLKRLLQRAHLILHRGKDISAYLRLATGGRHFG